MIEIRNSHTDTDHPILRHWNYCLHELKRSADALWQNCKSWELETLHLSRQYVHGLLPYHPGFEEPVWEETRSILPGLLALHDFGMLTSYSEPGSFVSEVENGMVIATRTRPHLFFSMPTTHPRIEEASIRKFLRGLEKNDQIWYHVRYHYPSENVPDSPTRAFPEYSGQLFTNIPGPDCTKFVCEQNKHGTADWEDESSQPFPGPEHRHQQGTGGLNDFDRPFNACLAVDPLQFCIVSREFTPSTNEKLDLQQLVLKLLEGAGFTRWPQPDSQLHATGEAIVMGRMHDRTEKDCVNEALKQLVICAEAAQNNPDCANGYALLRTDDTHIDETEDEAEELGRHNAGYTSTTQNTQFTPDEDSHNDEHIAPINTQQTVGHNSRPITSSNHFEQTRIPFTQADAAAALLSLTSSQ